MWNIEYVIIYIINIIMGAEIAGAIFGIVVDGMVNIKKHEVEEAMNLIYAKRYKEALEKYEILINKNPKEKYFWHNKGFCL